jgi:glucosyl-dolichyl phosphate glucuronosyltransferase
MKITVIQCAHNRCQTLAKALESAAALSLRSRMSRKSWWWITNSSDQTRQAVREFRQRYPHRFHYLFEAQQGKSYPLNAGIREARGDVLTFMDDDVTVQPR